MTGVSVVGPQPLPLSSWSACSHLNSGSMQRSKYRTMRQPELLLELSHRRAGLVGVSHRLLLFFVYLPSLDRDSLRAQHSHECRRRYTKLARQRLRALARSRSPHNLINHLRAKALR